MESRRLTFLIWTAVAASVGAWALYAFGPLGSNSSQTSASQTPVTPRGGLTGPAGVDVAPTAPVLAPALPPVAASGATGDRFRLVGLVAASGNEGLALIAVDGKPARAFRVGTVVDGDIVLREVTERGATLGLREGGATIALNASAAPAPPTGSAALAPMESGPSSPASLYDASARSRDRMGSKYPPLPPRADSAPQGTVGAAAPVPDDGRWTPPSGQ